MGLIARNKGVDLLDTVGKSVFDQKIQCPVRDRRLCTKPQGGQFRQDRIGPQRRMGRQQQLEHFLAHRRQPQSPLVAQIVCCAHQ